VTSSSIHAAAPHDPAAVRDAADLGSCLRCGYDRAGLGRRQACPECGVAPDPDAGAAVARALVAWPRRTLGALVGRRAVDGWWCLHHSSHALLARLQMVMGLTAATALLLVFFTAGAHVKAIVAVGPPLGPTGAQGTIYVVPTTASLAGVLRGDEGIARPGGGGGSVVSIDGGSPPVLPSIFVAQPSWSAFFVAQLVWSSCLPAAGLLGLRFFFLPFTMRRVFGGTTSNANGSSAAELRASAAIAADASIATAGLAGAIATIAAACAAFAAVLVVPTGAAVMIAGSARPALFTLLLVLPPVLVARAVASDGTRRVFPGPVRAAIALVLAYAAGLGCAVAVIGLTFTLASRLLV
jgi:hypothetical protein